MRMPAVSPVTALVGGGVTGWMCFGGAGVGFSAVLMGLVIFSGMATSFGLGGGSVFSLATTGAGLGASEVRTPVSSVRCVGGRGIDETMLAWMAPTFEASSPQCGPRLRNRNAAPTMIAATRPWSRREL